MPLTPFHVIVVWPLYVRWPRRWDLLALTFGAVMPDLEIVTLYPILEGAPGRGIMHSFLGVASVNLGLALLAACVVVPRIAARLDRRAPGRGWRRFAGRDFVADPKSWQTGILSGIVGGLSHLVLDLPIHEDTPLLWPWRGIAFALGPWTTDPVAIGSASVATGAAFVWMTWRWLGR